jgi:hypothetical protein
MSWGLPSALRWAMLLTGGKRSGRSSLSGLWRPCPLRLAPPKRSDATYATDPGGAIACQHGVILAMVVSVLASASPFGVLMYITPILENVTRLSADSVTLMLFLLGGRLGDWSLTPSAAAGSAAHDIFPVTCARYAPEAHIIPFSESNNIRTG